MIPFMVLKPWSAWKEQKLLFGLDLWGESIQDIDQVINHCAKALSLFDLLFYSDHLSDGKMA